MEKKLYLVDQGQLYKWRSQRRRNPRRIKTFLGKSMEVPRNDDDDDGGVDGNGDNDDSFWHSGPKTVYSAFMHPRFLFIL